MTDSKTSQPTATSESWDAVKQAHKLDGDAERLKEYYDKWATNYDQDVSNEQYCGPNYIVELLNELPEKTKVDVDPTNEDLAILDAGCGTGLVGIALHQQGYKKVDGFDLSPEMIAVAEKTDAYNSLQGDVDMTQPLTDYQDNQYDVTVSCGVFTLGHVPPESLTELVRITKQGGLILISTRKSYSQTTAFGNFCKKLEQQGQVKLVHHVPDGPYIDEEGAEYWALAVA
jgi:2-polyprenyl-3-methyl-5-hydroxy-6-metoxy-1,4-benzoquinol methylase